MFYFCAALYLSTGAIYSGLGTFALSKLKLYILGVLSGQLWAMEAWCGETQHESTSRR